MNWFPTLNKYLFIHAFDYVFSCIVKTYELVTISLKILNLHYNYLIMWHMPIIAWHYYNILKYCALYIFYNSSKYTRHSFIYVTNADGSILGDDLYLYHYHSEYSNLLLILIGRIDSHCRFCCTSLACPMTAIFAILTLQALCLPLSRLVTVAFDVTCMFAF